MEGFFWCIVFLMGACGITRAAPKQELSCTLAMEEQIAGIQNITNGAAQRLLDSQETIDRVRQILNAMATETLIKFRQELFKFMKDHLHDRDVVDKLNHLLQSTLHEAQVCIGNSTTPFLNFINFLYQEGMSMSETIAQNLRRIRDCSIILEIPVSGMMPVESPVPQSDDAIRKRIETVKQELKELVNEQLPIFEMRVDGLTACLEGEKQQWLPCVKQEIVNNFGQRLNDFLNSQQRSLEGLAVDY